MITKNINFVNFKKKINKLKIKSDLRFFLKGDSEVLKSLSESYKYNYSKKLILELKKFLNVKIIGMGGSALGIQAIHDFLRHKVNKNIIFVNNLDTNENYLKDKNKSLNLIISKSGNTLETIANTNFLVKKNDKNVFVTEEKKSYLKSLASQIKSDVISHNNFIGGRYSVLSEVGMLPAELMGLNEKKFKQLNNLIKNKKLLLKSHSYLSNKNIQKIIYSQMLATQNVFKRKKIPYRSFEILQRNEKTLGEIFCFFILETILLGRALKVNPFDQPSVELIKKETKKILLRN